MPDERNIVAIQLEKLINSVTGVVSCKVVLDEHGGVAEVHILSGSQRSPKLIVRDVETTCMVQLGMELDHKKISIAQVHDDLVTTSSKRLLLRSINFAMAESQVDVTVELAYGDRVEVGRASGIKTQGNQQRLLGKATLQAMTGFLDDRQVFVLEQVAIQQFAQRDLALVVVTMLGQDKEEMLVGTAFVRGDQREAIVRATLDAVNRRSWQLMTQ